MAILADHPRYQDNWRVAFDDAIDAVLRPGVVVLDVGSGRTPALDRSRLPAGSTYVGLDISADELAAAPRSSYDRAVCRDVREFEPSLRGCVDLVVSWQVFEHVAPLSVAIDNLYRYLRPGGTLVAQFSGGLAFFALVNRVVPPSVARPAMARLLRRDPKSVFPATYDHCTFSGLTQLFSYWQSVEITPWYRGAEYLRFLPAAQLAYLKVEDIVSDRGHRDLATHYLVVARR